MSKASAKLGVRRLLLTLAISVIGFFRMSLQVKLSQDHDTTRGK
jgi:hypothetical protein